MSYVSFGNREVSFKIVYYGPPLGGKTTNLEQLHAALPEDVRGPITILSTQKDRTLYFDFLPLQSKVIRGFVSKFQLYTVPGQPIYNDTRRIVLSGVDGVVFVADSQWSQMENNAESFANLHENLGSYGLKLEKLPHILEFNKRDLPDIAPADYMNLLLNKGPRPVPTCEAIAVQGGGVFGALNAIAKLVMGRFMEKYNMEVSESVSTEGQTT